MFQSLVNFYIPFMLINTPRWLAYVGKINYQVISCCDQIQNFWIFQYNNKNRLLCFPTNTALFLNVLCNIFTKKVFAFHEWFLIVFYAWMAKTWCCNKKVYCPLSLGKNRIGRVSRALAIVSKSPPIIITVKVDFSCTWL